MSQPIWIAGTGCNVRRSLVAKEQRIRPQTFYLQAIEVFESTLNKQCKLFITQFRIHVHHLDYLVSTSILIPNYTKIIKIIFNELWSHSTSNNNKSSQLSRTGFCLLHSPSFVEDFIHFLLPSFVRHSVLLHHIVVQIFDINLFRFGHFSGRPQDANGVREVKIFLAVFSTYFVTLFFA